MPTRKRIQPGEKVPLKLTATERKLVLDLLCLDPEYEQAVKSASTGQAVMMSLDDLDDFAGCIAAESNHCDNRKKQKALDAVFAKIQGLLDKYTDDEPPQSIRIEDQRQAKAMATQSSQIAEHAAQALAKAEQSRTVKKPLEHFWLAPAQRDVLLLTPGIKKTIKTKLARQDASFTVADVAGMIAVLAEELRDGDARQQAAVLLVAKHLIDQLQERIGEPGKPTKRTQPKSKPATGTLFQFKITLLGAKPSIWRRIQVQDCTLDELHEHIQTAMGWTNSHLHQFEINGERYGDPELLDDGFDDFDCIDSRKTMLSDILSKNGKRFRFKYEYDFGDSWEHEVLFEGRPAIEPGKKYPRCLEGERACPPEDVGGVWGYEEFLAAIADPKHEEHDSYMEWSGGSFSAEAFDPAEATRRMTKGLPDWRKMT